MFIDESGFLLIPPLRKTWAPRGRTPIHHHHQLHDRLSVISGISVSPHRKRLGLYFNFCWENISQKEVCCFLRYLLRHLRGPVIVIWDNGTPHKGVMIREFLRKYQRLHLENFPPYAPELNPDEGIWSQAKDTMANGRPDTLGELWWDLRDTFHDMAASQSCLRACFHQSELPSFFT